MRALVLAAALVFNITVGWGWIEQVSVTPGPPSRSPYALW